MKMKKKVVCILFAAIFLIGGSLPVLYGLAAPSASATSGGREEYAEQPAGDDRFSDKTSLSLSPNILLGSYDFGGKTVSGNKEFILNYTLTNTSTNITIQNIVVKVSGGDVYTIARGSNSSYIKSIAPNGSAKQSVPLIAGLNAESGNYPVMISVTFEYFDNDQKGAGSADLSVTVPLSQEDRFSFTNLGMGSKVYTDQEQNVTFNLINMGYTSMKNIDISILDSAGKVLTNVFYGAVEPSAQIDDGSKLTLTPDREGEITYTLKMVYEDKFSNKKEYQQNFTVRAEKYVNPYEQNSTLNPDVVQTQTPSSGMYIGFAVLALAVIIAIIVIITVSVKKKRAKKAQEAQALTDA